MPSAAARRSSPVDRRDRHPPRRQEVALGGAERAPEMQHPLALRPHGLGLELRYIEIDPASRATKVHSRVGFSEHLAMIIGPAIVRAGQDNVANEEK